MNWITTLKGLSLIGLILLCLSAMDNDKLTIINEKIATVETRSSLRYQQNNASPEFMDFIMGTGAAANNSTIVTCSGNFYDSGGQGNNYANNQDLALTFTAASNQLKINFTEFNLETDATCRWDYIQIYDGTSTSGTLFGEYCGIDSPGSITSTTGSLHIVFHSDNTVTTSGWEATISCDGVPIPANLTCGSSSNEISGTVFEDYNFDGSYAAGEEFLGVAGVNVKATDSLGNSTTTVTGNNGAYSFASLIATRTYRVEFTLPPALNWASPTFFNGDNGTTVQFLKPGDCANLGVANSADYCQGNPQIATTCFIDGEPLGGGSSGIGDVIVAYPYSSSGTNTANNEYLADNFEMGSVWGLAYQRKNKALFAGAIMKRHVGFGPLGIGGIYKVDYTDPNNTIVTNWLDLNTVTNVGTDPRNYSLPINSGVSSPDSIAYNAVGRIGIGDIDISEDEDTLYVVNLNNNGSLVKIDMNTKGLVAEIPFGNPGCGSAADVRPWAVKYHKGKVYAGLICSGENAGAADMKFFVQRLDGNTWTTVLTSNLTYPKGDVHNSYTGGCDDWEIWSTTFDQVHQGGSAGGFPRWCRPQPMLSDLEFGEDGSLYLGFMDRNGHQTGYRQRNTNNTETGNGYIGGDILKAYNNNGTFVLESNGVAGTTGCGVNNGEGPGGGEFFCSDTYSTIHDENSIGSLAYLKGSERIVLNIMDPINVFSGGTAWMSVNDGTKERAFQVFTSSTSGTFGKAAGLGDLELLCSAAPIEIGNYVWKDDNGDGIQDAGEIGIEGIRVELYDVSGNLLAFDTTDADGQYYFSGKDINIDNATWVSTNDTLQTNTDYYIALGNGQFNTTDLLIDLGGEDYELTLDSTNSGINRFELDSDGTISSTTPNNSFNNLPATLITTGDGGDVDHSFDFGFKKIEYDFGDLPDLADGTTGNNDYETIGANGGPSHRIKNGLLLGNLIDADEDGVPSTTATGDDINDGLDDEDGIVFLNSLTITPGGMIRLPFSVINTTGDTAYVVAWIDWDGDGDFDGGAEMVVNLKDDKNGTFPEFLEINIPDTPLNNNLLGVRLRLSNENNLTPYGPANSGEVEDYLIEVDCSVGTCLSINSELIRE